MKKHILSSIVLALVTTYAYADGWLDMSANRSEIRIESNTDHLAIRKITVNRGNCRGWSWDNVLKSRISSAKRTLLRFESDIKGIERAIETYESLPDGNPYKQDIPEQRQKLERAKKKYEQAKVEFDAKLKEISETPPEALGYGEVRNYSYSCDGGVIKEVEVELANGKKRTYSLSRR